MTKPIRRIVILFIPIILLSLIPACSKKQKNDNVLSTIPEDTMLVQLPVDGLAADDLLEGDPTDIPMPADDINEPADVFAGDHMAFKTTENVNLREGPGTDTARITTVPKGTMINVLDVSNTEWYWVDYKGQNGYMKSDYLREAADEPDPETAEEESEEKTEEAAEETAVEVAEDTAEKTADTPIPEQAGQTPPPIISQPIIEPPADVVIISGKQYSTSVTGLDLTSVAVSNEDIAALVRLPNLTSLKLAGGYTDIAPLANIRTLTELIMYCHNVSDITPLAGLSNLTRLHVIGDNISDLTPLASLRNLTELVIGYNKISDLSPLSGLGNLVSLTVFSHQISDLRPLANLTRLNSLTLYEQNNISDFSPVAHVPNVTGRL
ncbi:MAG: SH3 domain-containing protein [Clostridiales bacterium]|nr:SH3 domain-containing protein [Clostridiales bacterium]